MYSSDITKQFHIPTKYDYSISINISGSDQQVKQEILNSIFFDLKGCEFQALSPDANIKTLSQLFFITFEKNNLTNK